jgi:hypothetical protein
MPMVGISKRLDTSSANRAGWIQNNTKTTGLLPDQSIFQETLGCRSRIGLYTKSAELLTDCGVKPRCPMTGIPLIDGSTASARSVHPKFNGMHSTFLQQSAEFRTASSSET